MSTFSRPALVEWYVRNRTRSKALFDLVSEEAYYSRPIALRHPIVFYEGHLPAFSFNTLVKRGLGRDSIDPSLERLFARGIDPHESSDLVDAPGRGMRAGWPSREVVRRFADEADRQVLEALEHADLDRPGHPLLDRAEAVFTILEHEAMHQETLLYMWHRLPLDQKQRPAGYVEPPDAAVPRDEWIVIPAGRATLGVDRDGLLFGWDNERPAATEDVGEFVIQRHNVTNAAFLEFVEAGGYDDPQWWHPDNWAWLQAEGIRHPLFWERLDEAWPAARGESLASHRDGRGAPLARRDDREYREYLRKEQRSQRGCIARRMPPDFHHGLLWRGMFDRMPLPFSWPVYVSHAEASAYAKWRGARLPTEAEFQRAAYGTPAHPIAGAAMGTPAEGERQHPWGTDAPTPAHGAFDFSTWDPQPAGSHPDGRSAWGVDDLVGNGWEWTSSVFAPFPGFTAMPSYPEYSADFFDGEHFVMKGASPVTARELLRPTFRNWFRARYPYVYATFRCVRVGRHVAGRNPVGYAR